MYRGGKSGPLEVFEPAGLLESGKKEAELEPPVISTVDLIGSVKNCRNSAMH